MSSETDREVIRPMQHERVIVERNDAGYAMAYVGEDPDTRYLPERRSFASRMWERLRIGLHGPEHVRAIEP